MNDSVKNTLRVGTILNEKWVILEFLDKGGMGEVYRAHQVNLKRDVAIKVISREWISCIADDDEEVRTALQRFEREVHAMAQMRHPNVVQVYDYGSDALPIDGESTTIQYLVMEYVPGNTLRETMSEQGFDPEEDLVRDWLRRYFLPMLDGLGAIHEAHMVHRDMKPENFLMDGEIPKIADFGIASSCRWRAVTNSIDIKGTVMYMPPEQFSDLRRTDRRADIYSLGKILYEAVVGKLSEKNKSMLFKQVCLKNPETVFFKELSRIIHKATSENKEDRFDSVDQIRKEILNLLSLPEKEKSIGSATAETNTNFFFSGRSVWLKTAITLAVISLLSITFWHFFSVPAEDDVSKTKNSNKAVKNLVLSDSKPNTKPSNAPLTTPDGSTMSYIPAGEFALSENREQKIVIDAFYMDETPVTNQQFVQFLNEVEAGVGVQNDVVIGEGNIWLILGEVFENYDPIAYKAGKFSITHSVHSACPVLRVTAFGAQAYARFYEKSLPSDAQWLYVYREGTADSKEPDFLPIPSPVLLFEPNQFGIRGLNQSISECATRSNMVRDKNLSTGPEYMIMGNVGLENLGDEDLAAVKRLPWEAFEEVGFRCVREGPQRALE